MEKDEQCPQKQDLNQAKHTQSLAYTLTPSHPLYFYPFLILASVFVDFMLLTILQILKEPASFEVIFLQLTAQGELENSPS